MFIKYKYLYLHQQTNKQKQNKMKNYTKGLTLSKEELELVGIMLEMGINNRMMSGASPERFKVLKEIKTRLEQSKK